MNVFKTVRLYPSTFTFSPSNIYETLNWQEFICIPCSSSCWLKLHKKGLEVSWFHCLFSRGLSRFGGNLGKARVLLGTQVWVQRWKERRRPGKLPVIWHPGYLGLGLVKDLFVSDDWACETGVRTFYLSSPFLSKLLSEFTCAISKTVRMRTCLEMSV